MSQIVIIKRLNVMLTQKVLIALLFLFLLLSLIHWFPLGQVASSPNVSRFDERDHMFSRNNLQYHQNLAARYYSNHPDLKESDQAIHRLPELLNKGGRYYDEILAALGIAFDSFTSSTISAVGFKRSKHKFDINKEEITSLIIKTGQYLGAADVGITKLKKYHLYSHSGRQAENWGEPIETDHIYAIAILV